MDALSVSIMIFGTLVFIPSVLGKDVVVDMAKSCDKIFDHPYFALFSIKLIQIFTLLFLTMGSITFWYYWSVSALKNEMSLLIVYSVSIVSLGIIYFIYQYLLSSSPNNDSVQTKILLYTALSVGLLGSMGLIWIPSIVLLASQFWRLLVNVPLLVSGISGYFLFIVGIFLFLTAN